MTSRLSRADDLIAQAGQSGVELLRLAASADPLVQIRARQALRRPAERLQDLIRERFAGSMAEEVAGAGEGVVPDGQRREEVRELDGGRAVQPGIQHREAEDDRLSPAGDRAE